MMTTLACRMLIVEDQHIVRMGLRAMLQDAPGIEVVGEAATRPQALERVRELCPSVILIGAGGTSRAGLQLIAAIHRESPSTGIVILASPDSEPKLVYQAIRSGVIGLVSNESEVDELVAAIQSAADGRPYLKNQSLLTLLSFLRDSTDLSTDESQPGDELTEREQEVLVRVALGERNRDIAEALCLSESTVRSHLNHILHKLHLANRVQAATFAHTSGLVDGSAPGSRRGTTPSGRAGRTS